MGKERQTIWREGDLIRRTDHVGYWDGVTDEKIFAHIAEHQADPHDPLFVPFARAVLALRAFERASVSS